MCTGARQVAAVAKAAVRQAPATKSYCAWSLLHRLQLRQVLHAQRWRASWASQAWSSPHQSACAAQHTRCSCAQPSKPQANRQPDAQAVHAKARPCWCTQTERALLLLRLLLLEVLRQRWRWMLLRWDDDPRRPWGGCGDCKVRQTAMCKGGRLLLLLMVLLLRMGSRCCSSGSRHHRRGLCSCWRWCYCLHQLLWRRQWGRCRALCCATTTLTSQHLFHERLQLG
jgi:hypothetical protein